MTRSELGTLLAATPFAAHNTATLTELETIPGIGEVLAKQIVAHRPYTSIDQLVAIRGIGPSSIEELRPYMKVDGEPEKLR